MSFPRASAASAALGAILAAVALLARGGNDVGRMAAVEIVIVLAGGIVLATAVALAARDRPLYGAVALICFAVLTAVTALSMTWSIAPDETLEEAARSFAYLAIFAAAVAGARLAPRAAPVVVRGILLAAVAVVLYALASRVWPGAFDDALGARLGEPYDYWNALGATAALGVLPAIWLGTRETARPLTRAVALPALGLLILTILLTQSRGALVAAGVAVAVWLVVVPLRLRTVLLLAAPAAAAAPVAAWALSKDSFTEALQTLAAREAVAGEFGLLVLLMTTVLLVVGLLGEHVGSGRALPLVTRRRLGVAAGVAVAVWLVVVPLRLRTVLLLAVPAAAAAPVAAWALSKDSFTEALQTLAAREAVAGEFGLLVLLMTTVLLVVGLLGEHVGSGRALPLVTRRRLGVAAVVVTCAVPLVALTSVAMSDRGLSGTISDRFDELTDDTVAPPEGAARLGSVSSSRGGYWRQAGNVFEERPVLGTGAGSFRIARLPYRRDQTVSGHAHGFLPQTIADMGLLGLVAALALLAAWLAAAARSTGLERRREGRLRPEWSTERTALCALALCALVFGLQSAVDWIWFVPGPSAMALVAAGFVAGRGPLPALGETPAGREPRPLWRRPEPARIAAAAAVLVGAGLCAWAVWQPEASERASDRAFEELAAGDLEAASREADHAREVNPYSPEPLYAKAAVLEAAKRPTAAYHTLEQAVKEHPRDPETWLRLARFELDELDLPQRAVESLRGAFHLDPYSPQAVALMRRANGELGTDTAAGRAQPRERASAVAK